MLAPDVAIVDLEPDGFAALCALAAQRDRSRPPVLTVLHDEGTVLKVVHSVTGAVDDHREPFTDPQARASELLETTDARRVVVLDRRGLRELAAEADTFATPDRTQLELLWAANERFWSHPAVATAPAPPRHPWSDLPARLARLGDDFWGLVGVWRGEDPLFTLVANVRGGRIVLLTSGERFGWPRPPRPEAMRLVEHAEGLGPLPLVLLCDEARLEEALATEDLTEGLRTLAERSIHATGIEEVL